jgi:CRISPR-associated endonuclease/helicase Cas3
MYDTLLAKSTSDVHNPKYLETIKGHTVSVCNLSEKLGEKISLSIKDQINCSSDCIQAWHTSLWIAAWMHDWGKANSEFQKMIRNKAYRQGVRHEAVSIIIMESLLTWLRPVFSQLPDWASAGIVYSVAGHHLKFPDPLEGHRPANKLKIYLNHKDLIEILEYGRKRFSLEAVPVTTEISYSLSTDSFQRKVNRFIRNFHKKFNPREKVLIASLKTALTTLDLAGSAVPEKIDTPENWIKERIDAKLDKHQLQKVVRMRLKNSEPIEFQKKVSESNARTVLVEAGCGSGKTAAAYLWASQHAQGKRLFFCYPTTGTASEGFAGYLYDPDFDAILIHSRAQVDYRLLESMPDYDKEEQNLRTLGIEALETWGIPAVVCTAHTVLGLLENVRRGLYAWVSIVQGVFVFDEIHAFSDRLFSYLLRFLKEFPNVPVLLMTATLPAGRKIALEKICKDRGNLEIVKGPLERESAKRYVLVNSNLTEAWEKVEKTLKEGGKVLWISNTVNRAVEVYEKALENSLLAELYTSRFRYKDRLNRHRTVIDGFDEDKPSFLAVTTQVAEMSLDLSADLLVTEWAPIPSLIQRLGRLNRRETVPQTTKSALLIEPENLLPYCKKDQENLLRTVIQNWLEELSGMGEVSQRDLHDAFIKFSSENTDIILPVESCEWLDRPQETKKNSTSIEESGHTIEVIRYEDLFQGLPTENAIPMPFPKGDDWKNWEYKGRFLIAPSGSMNYSEKKGASWNK